MEETVDFRQATRRLLFRKAEKGSIPGEGRSAAELPVKHLRYKVTMNLDGDIVEYFKQRGVSEGRPYQLLINEALREYMSGSRPEQLAQKIGEILLSDNSFLDRVSERLLSDHQSVATHK